MRNTMTAEQMVLAALKILQRSLPPGDLDDRQVVTELWELLDNKDARAVYRRTDRGRSERHAVKTCGR